MFGGRQRSAIAPAQVPAARPPAPAERPPSRYPLNLGPGSPAAVLPYPAAEYGAVPRPPQYVHPYHIKNMPIGHQIAQLEDNTQVVAKAFPPRQILVGNPDGSLMYGGEQKSRELQSAERQLERARRQRYPMAVGGLVKSYGVGSSSLPRPRQPGDPPGPRLNTDITAELNIIDSDLRRLVADKRRLLPRSNDPGVMRQIHAIDRTLGDLRRRKIFIMAHYPDRD